MDDIEELLSPSVPMDDPDVRQTPPPKNVVTANLINASPKATGDILLKSIQETNANLAAQYPIIQKLNEEKQQAAVDAIVQTAEIGKNNEIIKSAQVLAEQEAQRRTAETATNLGVTGSNDTADLLNKRAKQWAAASEDALNKTDKLRHDSEIRFLDDPTGYVKAQFYLDNTAKEAQNAVDRQTQIARDLTTMQAQTQQAAVTYNAIKQTETTATVKATLDNVARDTNLKIDEMKAKNAGVSMEALDRLNNLTDKQLANLNMAHSSKLQDQQAQVAAEHLSLSKKSLQIQIVEFNERMDLKKTTKEEQDTMGQLLTEGLSIIGRSDGTKIPSSQVAAMAKTQAGQEAIARAVQSRMIGHPVVASSLSELTRIVGSDGSPLLPQQASVRQLLGSSFATAADPVRAKAAGVQVGNPNDVNQVSAAAAQLATKQATEYLANIKPGDKANPYSAPPFNTVMEIPGVQSSPLYQKVLKPQHAAGGIQDIDPSNLIATTASAIKAGTLTHDEAAKGLLTMFNAIVEKNKVNNNYIGMHLPNQDSYHTTITNPNGISSIRNMTSLPDINIMLDQQLRSVTPVGRALARSPFGFN